MSALTYKLAFQVGHACPPTAPEIIFIVDEQHFTETVQQLQLVITRSATHITAYLGEDETFFTLPFPDLFGKISFGYSDCGYVTNDSGKIYFRVPLRPHPWTHRCALTITLLARVFDSLSVNNDLDDIRQEIILMLLCDRSRLSGCGHSVGGWVSKRVMTWLKNYAAGQFLDLKNDDRILMHPAVIQAQQAAWLAVNEADMYEYANSQHITSRVYGSGAFIMTCFGNACDLGVYPSDYTGEEAGLIDLASHNLDTPEQQLTLVSGLAALCQLVRDSCKPQ